MPPVYAVAISANQASAGTTITKAQALRIQEAMANAVRYCYQEGIMDPDAMKEKMQEARASMKRKFAEEALEAKEEELRKQAGEGE